MGPPRGSVIQADVRYGFHFFPDGAGGRPFDTPREQRLELRNARGHIYRRPDLAPLLASAMRILQRRSSDVPDADCEHAPLPIRLGPTDGLGLVDARQRA